MKSTGKPVPAGARGDGLRRVQVTKIVMHQRRPRVGRGRRSHGPVGPLLCLVPLGSPSLLGRVACDGVLCSALLPALVCGVRPCCLRCSVVLPLALLVVVVRVFAFVQAMALALFWCWGWRGHCS